MTFAHLSSKAVSIINGGAATPALLVTWLAILAAIGDMADTALFKCLLTHLIRHHQSCFQNEIEHVLLLVVWQRISNKNVWHQK